VPGGLTIVVRPVQGKVASAPPKRGGVEGWRGGGTALLFLIAVLHGGQSPALTPRQLYPREQAPNIDWVGSKAGIEKNSFSFPEIETWLPSL
jgi:hypothetical protein